MSGKHCVPTPCTAASLGKTAVSLGRTAASAVLVEALLRCTTLPHTCRLLGIGLGTPGAIATTPTSPTRNRRLCSTRMDVARVYGWLPLPDTCLRRALTAGFRLREFQPRLVLGVQNRGRFRAPAWLEIAGEVLDWGDTHRDYVRIPF